jgi:putative DNA primase/helicase
VSLDIAASKISARRKKTPAKAFGNFSVVGGRTQPDDEETEELITELAALSDVRYEQARDDAAGRLGVRKSVLDGMVKAARKAKPEPDKPLVPERQPWATAVPGGVLISDLIADLRRYVSLEPDYAAVASFWVLHTYLINHTFITPRLAITAPQPRCGKTTLVNWLRTVVQRPLNTVNVSAAVVFHVAEDLQPTLLIDEADTFLGAEEGLRGILNSGHQKDGVVLRWDAHARSLRPYSTFCACAISLIGNLPSTLQDRSVRIRLRRRTPEEPISSLRGDKVNDELGRRCARWALDNEPRFANADPEIPEQLFNRVEDNWRPLLALADIVGGSWPKELRDIAVRIAALDAGEDPSADTQLLRDIHDIFEDQDWITTARLVARLQAREYKLTGKGLANRLKPYGIEPRQERRGDKVERGYLANAFTDAWTRYLGVPDVPDVPDADRDMESTESSAQRRA